jgi:hypothetical protein
MVVSPRTLLPVAVAAALCACNAPAPPGSTGGTTQPPGECGRGLVVIETDYQSTNVSLVGLDLAVLSSSFISSATDDPALSASLSGDVIPPTMTQSGSEIVLLDRYPAAVLTWVDVASAHVRAQLRVGTGFASNPQDYVLRAADKAYVTRYGQNPAPGAEPFDLGSDVLVIDPRTPAIVGRIDLQLAVAGEPLGVLPNPNRMLLSGDRLFVLLSPYSADFVQAADARLVTIDTTTDAIVDVLPLTGKQGCLGLALSADETRIAVGCSGAWRGSSTPLLDESGLVLLSLAAGGGGAGGSGAGGALPSVLARFDASELGDQPLGFAVDFADADHVLFTAFGRVAQGAEAAQQDLLGELELGTRELQILLRGQQQPFTLGEVRCAAPGAGCFVADAEQGLLRRFAGDGPWLTLAQSVAPAPEIGLPPRLVGRF